MAELIYPTNDLLYGPWLIDREDLEAFDGMIDQEWSRMNAYQEKKLAEEKEQEVERLVSGLVAEGLHEKGDKLRQRATQIVENRPRSLSLYRSRAKRIINIQLKGKRIQVESFGEASRHPELLAEIPRK